MIDSLRRALGISLAGVLLAGTTAFGQGFEPAPAVLPTVGALAKMPVKELTVFKDGHAYVVHQGKLPVAADGTVVLDYLPIPVFGTFWTSAADEGVKVVSTVSSRKLVATDRTALSIRELLEGNPGAAVTIRERPLGQADPGVKYEATIVGVPERGSEELERTSPPGTPAQLPIKGEIVMLKTADGTKALPIDHIAEVIFKDKPGAAAKNVEFRNALTLKLDGAKAGAAADVRMMYVQRGLRWIPSYKVTIDGKGGATIQLEATLINELADFENANVNLVVGVPTFRFEDEVDPIALQQTLASLAPQMRQSLMNTSNMMMSQVAQQQAAMPVDEGGRPAGPANLGPAIGDGAQREDLFVFPLKNLTLRKGQRLVVPVGQVQATYTDVYVLDVPFSPPTWTTCAASSNPPASSTTTRWAPPWNSSRRTSPRARP